MNRSYTVRSPNGEMRHMSPEEVSKLWKKSIKRSANSSTSRIPTTQQTASFDRYEEQQRTRSSSGGREPPEGGGLPRTSSLPSSNHNRPRLTVKTMYQQRKQQQKQSPRESVYDRRDPPTAGRGFGDDDSPREGVVTSRNNGGNSGPPTPRQQQQQQTMHSGPPTPRQHQQQTMHSGPPTPRQQQSSSPRQQQQQQNMPTFRNFAQTPPSRKMSTDTAPGISYKTTSFTVNTDEGKKLMSQEEINNHVRSFIIKARKQLQNAHPVSAKITTLEDLHAKRLRKRGTWDPPDEADTVMDHFGEMASLAEFTEPSVLTEPTVLKVISDRIRAREANASPRSSAALYHQRSGESLSDGAATDGLVDSDNFEEGSGGAAQGKHVPDTIETIRKALYMSPSRSMRTKSPPPTMRDIGRQPSARSLVQQQPPQTPPRTQQVVQKFEPVRQPRSSPPTPLVPQSTTTTATNEPSPKRPPSRASERKVPAEEEPPRRSRSPYPTLETQQTKETLRSKRTLPREVPPVYYDINTSEHMASREQQQSSPQQSPAPKAPSPSPRSSPTKASDDQSVGRRSVASQRVKPSPDEPKASPVAAEQQKSSPKESKKSSSKSKKSKSPAPKEESEDEETIQLPSAIDIMNDSDIAKLVELSMKKAQRSAREQVQELLQDSKRRHNNQFEVQTESGTKLMSQEEIATLVKDSMKRARESAQQEIENLVKDSVRIARESAQREIREMVEDSMRRARETAQKEMSEIVRDSLQRARGHSDASVVSRSTLDFTLSSFPPVRPMHAGAKLPTPRSAMPASQNETPETIAEDKDGGTPNRIEETTDAKEIIDVSGHQEPIPVAKDERPMSPDVFDGLEDGDSKCEAPLSPGSPIKRRVPSPQLAIHVEDLTRYPQADDDDEDYSLFREVRETFKAGQNNSFSTGLFQCDARRQNGSDSSSDYIGGSDSDHQGGCTAPNVADVQARLEKLNGTVFLPNAKAIFTSPCGYDPGSPFVVDDSGHHLSLPRNMIPENLMGMDPEERQKLQEAARALAKKAIESPKAIRRRRKRSERREKSVARIRSYINELSNDEGQDSGDEEASQAGKIASRFISQRSRASKDGEKEGSGDDRGSRRSSSSRKSKESRERTSVAVESAVTDEVIAKINKREEMSISTKELNRLIDSSSPLQPVASAKSDLEETKSDLEQTNSASDDIQHATSRDSLVQAESRFCMNFMSLLSIDEEEFTVGESTYADESTKRHADDTSHALEEGIGSESTDELYTEGETTFDHETCSVGDSEFQTENGRSEDVSIDDNSYNAGAWWRSHQRDSIEEDQILESETNDLTNVQSEDNEDGTANKSVPEP